MHGDNSLLQNVVLQNATLKHLVLQNVELQKYSVTEWSATAVSSSIPAEDERPRGRPIRVRPVSGIRRFDSRITEKIPFLLDIRCKASPQAILDKERRILTAVQAKKSPISRPLSALDGVSGRAKTSSVDASAQLCNANIASRPSCAD